MDDDARAVVITVILVSLDGSTLPTFDGSEAVIARNAMDDEQMGIGHVRSPFRLMNRSGHTCPGRAPAKQPRHGSMCPAEDGELPGERSGASQEGNCSPGRLTRPQRPSGGQCRPNPGTEHPAAQPPWQ